MEKTTSTVFKTTSTPVEDSVPTGKTPHPTPVDEGVETSYTNYNDIKGHSYLVDYFELGDFQDTFMDEIGIIDKFLLNKIKTGDIADNKKSIDKEIKLIEKLNNVKDEERTVIRLGVLSEYINFLNNTKNIKKYGVNN